LFDESIKVKNVKSKIKINRFIETTADVTPTATEISNKISN